MDDKVLEKKLRGLKSPKLPSGFSKQVMTAIYEQKVEKQSGPILVFQRAINYASLGIFGVLCVYGLYEMVLSLSRSGVSEYFGLIFSNFDVFAKHVSLVLGALFKAFPKMIVLEFGLYVFFFIVSVKMYKVLHSLKYIKVYG